MDLTTSAVLKNLKNQYAKPSVIGNLGKHISDSLQEELKLNKTFYLNLNNNAALFHLIEKSLKNQIIKQEFSIEYNEKYNAEYTRLVKEYSALPPFELQAAYPAEVEQAKSNYFTTLYNRINSRILNYINLNEQDNKQVNERELKEIAELMHLRSEVNSNAEFVKDIVKKLEEKEFMRDLPQSAALILAKDISKLYNFNLAEELAKVRATQIAEEDLQKGFDSASALIKRRVDRKLEDCKEILKSSNAPRIHLNEELKNDNRFGDIVGRMTQISNRIFDDYKITLYHNAFGYIKNSVFKDDKIMSENTFELSDQIKPLNVTMLLEEYANQFSRMFNNSSKIVSLEAELLTDKTLTDTQIQEKQEQIKWYKTNTEMLYNFVEIVERQKAIKNVLGAVTTEILSFNETKYSSNRVAAAFDSLQELVPNITPSFINGIGKTAFTNYAKNGTAKPSVGFDEFIKLVQIMVETSKEELQINDKVNITDYANKIATIVRLNVEQNEEAGVEYNSQYQTTIDQAKLLVNIKRYSEFAKVANDLTVLKSAFEYEYNKLDKQTESYFTPEQLELVTENDLALKFELENITDSINGVLKRYANNEKALTEFVVSFVNELKNEVLAEPNPKIRQNLLNAYAEPLVKNEIIANNDELVKAVEVLAKREDRNYKKISQELETFEDAINIKEIIKLNLTEELNKYTLEREAENKKASAKDKKEQKTKNAVKENEEPVQPAAPEVKETPEVEVKPQVKEHAEIVNEPKSEEEVKQEEAVKKANEPEVKPIKVTMEQQFEEIKAVNLRLINQDAHTYMQNEILRQKLEGFDKLTSQEKVDVLNAANVKNAELGIRGSLDYSSFKGKEETLKTEAQKVSAALESANREIISKYSATSDHEKVAFVVLSLTKSEETIKQEVQTEAQKAEQAIVKPARSYNLSDKKEYSNAKNDMFWKMQLQAIESKGVLEESLNNENLDDFNALAPVVKLFEIAASDNLALSEVSLQNIGQLNYQQLARVSILKYKEGKIEDQQTVDLVNHIISNTSSYSKTEEYNKIVDEFLTREEIAKELNAGTKTLDELIELEVQNNGALKEVVEAFNQKTSPTITKEGAVAQGDALDDGGSTITI